MNKQSILKAVLIGLFVAIGFYIGSNIANAEDIFVSQPVATMTGHYTLNEVVDGVEQTTPFPKSGVAIEVNHAGDEKILGGTFPGTFIFGTVYFPNTGWFAFNTTGSSTANTQYQKMFDIVTYDVITTNTNTLNESQIGTGTITFDPAGTGDGHTADLKLTFSPAFSINGTSTSSIEFMMHRITNEEVDACLPVDQFSPVAPFGTLSCH